MSPSSRSAWFRSGPKKPPPARGIKMKKSGATWWGQRWIQALERMSAGYSSRLDRGRTYARAGRTHDLAVTPGRVTAKVTGSRATPYEVVIELPRLSDAVWISAVAAMATQAKFSVELLSGEMPRDIDDVFEQAGASLFPRVEADLETDCSCPDWANPCKHVAATHYVLGEAFDRDPFLLFELRGRTKAQVLEALRAARTGAEFAPADQPSARHPGEPSSMPFDATPADYDRPRQPLPVLTSSFQAPPVAGSVLRQLGTPAGWITGSSPLDVFGPMIRAAADRARALAMAETSPEEPPVHAPSEAPPRSERPRPKRARAAAPKAKKKSSQARKAGKRRRRAS